MAMFARAASTAVATGKLLTVPYTESLCASSRARSARGPAGPTMLPAHAPGIT